MKKIIIAFVALAALTVASCKREELKADGRLISGREDNTLMFTILDEIPATRALKAEADDPDGVIDLGRTEGGMPLVFVESVTRPGIPECIPATKGAPATTDNVSDLYGSFSTVAYDGTSPVTLDGQTEFVFSPSTIEGKWVHTFDNNPWDAHNNLYFFAYMPEKPAGTTFNPSAKTISFSYTMPAAAEQKDIVFGGQATTKSAFDADPSAGFPITFHHALAGVRFIIGNDANSTLITQLTLKGIVKTGSFVITPGATTPVACTPGSATANFTLAVPEETEVGDESLTLWLIPQTLSDDAELEVTYTVNGATPRTVSAKINAALGGALTLTAGELHTFTLNPDDVDVSITDEISEGVKQNIVITNTGNVAAYLRAVIVANWQDADGNIVAAWDFAPEEFTGLPGEGWTQKSDGYYYTTSAVAAGEDAPALFSTYTPPASPADGAHLVMDIAVQAVNSKPVSWAE